MKENINAKLVNGLIDRKVVKQTVMTSVYDVTCIGARKQIQARLEEKLLSVFRLLAPYPLRPCCYPSA